MQYKEDLMWILDKNGVRLSNTDAWQKARDENIAFVHSLGKKCDCVGWSTLKRDDPKAEEILDRISAFCKENGWTARGLYTREYENLETDWYAVQSVFFKDGTVGKIEGVPDRDGGTLKTHEISAYRELLTGPKTWGKNLYLPDRFRKACLKHNLSGLEFCWVKDTGKYAAEQYFQAFGTVRISRVATGWNLKRQDLCKLPLDSGWLPRLGEVIGQWTQLQLPYCYLKEDMPAAGIAYAYIPQTFHCCGLYEVLIHKDIAKLLLQEKAISANALMPAPVVDALPGGYTRMDTEPCPRPLETYMAQSIANYEKLIVKARPERKISEKDALKVMRKAKTDRKGDFQKKLPQKREEEMLASKFAPLVPYYKVAEGGFLSDEYELLAQKDIQTETAEFYDRLEKEELLEKQPEGMVIARCANGDKVLLLKEGSVIRFSHEEPDIVDEWQSLAQFVFDAVSEE